VIRPTLTVTTGLPGAGKSSWARQQPGAVTVDRDGLRRLLHPGEWPHGDELWEDRCTRAQLAMVRALLESEDDIHVIVHDINLDEEHVALFEQVAEQCGALLLEQDFTDVPLDVCIERDARRPEAERVGEAVIRDLHARYLSGGVP
jgi:predicted kinase